MCYYEISKIWAVGLQSEIHLTSGLPGSNSKEGFGAVLGWLALVAV